MKNLFKKIGKYALAGIVSSALVLGAYAVQADNSSSYFIQNAPNVLMTNTGGGLATAALHVGSCYIGTGTSTPCGSGGGGGTPATPFDGIQYNNAGSFGADANHTLDPVTGDLLLKKTLLNGKDIQFLQNSNIGGLGIQGSATAYGTLITGGYIAQIVGDFSGVGGDAYTFGTFSTVGNKNINATFNGTAGNFNVTTNDTGTGKSARIYLDSSGNGTLHMEGTDGAQFAVLQNGNNHQYFNVDITDKPIIKAGDIGGHGNGTLQTIDDNNKVINNHVVFSGTQTLDSGVTASFGGNAQMSATDTAVGSSGASSFVHAGLAGGLNASIGYYDVGSSTANQFTANSSGVDAYLGYGGSSTFSIKNGNGNPIFTTNNISNPDILMGDISGAGHKTTLEVDDISQRILGITDQVLIKEPGNSNPYVNFTANGGNPLIVLGPYGYGNQTNLTIDDTGRLIRFGYGGGISYSFPNTNPTTGQTIVADGVGGSSWGTPVTGTVSGTDKQVSYFNGTTSIVSDSNFLWDYTNKSFSVGGITSGNGTRFFVNDQTQSISSVTNGTFALADDLGNKFIQADIAGSQYGFGDVNDTGDKGLLFMNSAGYMNLGYDNTNLLVSKTGDNIQMNTSNSTLFFVSGLTNTVEAHVDGNYNVMDSLGNHLIQGTTADMSLFLGDVDGKTLGGVLKIDNTSNSVELGFSGGNQMQFTGTTGSIIAPTINFAGPAIAPYVTFKQNSGNPIINLGKSTIGNGTELLVDDPNQVISVNKPFVMQGYTVATLPTGVVGARAYVTDALAPVFGSTVVAGGTVTIPVFFNGTNWIVD